MNKISILVCTVTVTASNSVDDTLCHMTPNKSNCDGYRPKLCSVIFAGVYNKLLYKERKLSD